MMKAFRFTTVFALAAVLLSAQTILTPTTLSTAVGSASVQSIVVASASPNSSTADNLVAGNSVYVDRELMTIKAVSGTQASVIRAQGGTGAAPHASGALVFVGQPFRFASGDKQGACTRTKEVTLPVFNVKTGSNYDCLGGTWEHGDPGAGTQTSARWRIWAPDNGSGAYTGINTNGTQAGNTTLYCTEVWLPSNKLLTGIALLNGTTTGTDKRYVVLYDAGGVALANSSLTGATTGTASIYQAHAFTSTYFAVGPAQYFACFQTDTGTDTTRMIVTGISGDNTLTKGQTAATFGTVPTLTVPTTFTTAVGPYVYLY